jgi:hypothetical protein
MKDADPKGVSGRPPLRRPDPDKIAQGDEAAERKKERARRDVTEGDRAPGEPEEERSDRMAKRGLESRPAIMP